MTVFEYYTDFKLKLEKLHSAGEADAITRIIAEHVTGLSYWKLRFESEPKHDYKKTSDDYLIRLLQHEPVQYILGSTEFMNLKFKVDHHVLIPRPETEEIVQWIINHLPKNNTYKIIDFCTGSGCIAVSLGKNFIHSTIHATDVLPNTLEIARINAKENNQEVHLHLHDLLSDEINGEWFDSDIVVSNPPYIGIHEKDEIEHNVSGYEPHQALFSPSNDTLIFYRKIAEVALQILKPDGLLVVEINQKFAKETEQIFISKGYKKIAIHEDMNGNSRFITAYK